jgi:hypothetical protein
VTNKKLYICPFLQRCSCVYVLNIQCRYTHYTNLGVLREIKSSFRLFDMTWLICSRNYCILLLNGNFSFISFPFVFIVNDQKKKLGYKNVSYFMRGNCFIPMTYIICWHSFTLNYMLISCRIFKECNGFITKAVLI